MLTSPGTTGLSTGWPSSKARTGTAASSIGSVGGGSVGGASGSRLGRPRRFAPSAHDASPLGELRSGKGADEQHVFIVVGVPGSGKDTVIKRYLRTLGLTLLDASADLVKEYLAAWGFDELSVLVRENNARCGPGKHLLHAQYLHRESLLLNEQIVDKALDDSRSTIIEKTLHDADHVLEQARRISDRGCKVHLFGTLITPLKNWDFLRNRMLSGQAFGRYITKQQAVSSLRQYHKHFSAIVREPELRRTFDSIHLYDVIKGEWCVSIAETSVRYIDDPPDA